MLGSVRGGYGRIEGSNHIIFKYAREKGFSLMELRNHCLAGLMNKSDPSKGNAS